MNDDAETVCNDLEQRKCKKFKGDNNVFKEYYKEIRQLNHFQALALPKLSHCEESLIARVVSNEVVAHSVSSLHLQEPSKWKWFDVPDVPGLSLVRNIFTPLGELYWPLKCLTNYALKPNRRNTDQHEQSCDDYWTNSVKQLAAGTQMEKTDVYKLRWITMGYHYQWAQLSYPAAAHSPVDPELIELCTALCAVLQLGDFTPEAVITNLYHHDSFMGPHVDDAERDVSRPLLSLSFGQTALFLVGTDSLTDEPLPLLLNSGDLLVMSGQSRAAYHAVARLLPVSLSHLSASFKQLGLGEDEEIFFRRYIQLNRVNLNIRQVEVS